MPIGSAVKQIYSRAETGLRDEQYKIEHRFANLVGTPVDEDNNPLCLAVLCHTFHDALQTVTSPRLARRVVFESFDQTVVANLKEFYDQLNEFMERSGVLPGLEQPVPKVAKLSEASGERRRNRLQGQEATEPETSVAPNDTYVGPAPAGVGPAGGGPASANTGSAPAGVGPGPTGVGPAPPISPGTGADATPGTASHAQPDNVGAAPGMHRQPISRRHCIRWGRTSRRTLNRI